METTPQSEPARTLGKYTLIEKLGEGSLGHVFRGLDPEFGRAVVVRILGEGIQWNAQVEEILLRECRTIAGLRHPNIAAIYEVGKEGQSAYIAMESLGGNNLGSLIARKPAMSVEAKLSIMVRVADGLSHAHRNGILHRNLEPAKIHLTADGEIKIRDFAIAHALGKHLPRPGALNSAPVYLSPEQVQHKDGDEKSDIFSAGTIFYELITYRHPFHDQDSNKALDNILQDKEIPAFEQFPNEPPGIWPILKTCLARDPKDRYKSMDEVSVACRELLKDVADDTRLMLAELHASLAPLKRAAAQPGASESTIKLLQDVQKILSSDERTDYGSLDRLMNGLIEQQPAIQEAASGPQTLEADRLQFLPAISGVPVAVEAGALPLNPAVIAGDAPVQMQPVVTILSSSMPEQPVELEDKQQIPPAAIMAAENKTESPLISPAATSEPPRSPAISPVEPEAEMPVAAIPDQDAAMPPEQVMQAGIEGEEPQDYGEAAAAKGFVWIPRLTYRSAAVLLSVLLIVAAVYIILGKGAASLSNAWPVGTPDSQMPVNASIPQPASGNAGGVSTGRQAPRMSAERNTASVLLKEARALAAMNRTEESKVLFRRILEIDPSSEAAVAALKEIEEASGTDFGNPTDQALQKQLARISSLINSGKLLPAKAELDKLCQIYPDSPEVNTLRKRWQARNSKEAQERAGLEEEHKAALKRKQRDDEWNRKLAELLALGKYSEAGGALSIWLTEDPGSSRAKEFSAKIQEIQRGLKTYASAMSENRYQEALDALGGAERLNPADSSFTELRRQVEVRRAAAKASLTIHRLGTKGVLLLDGRPIGSDGEIANESVAIGGHTLAIEDSGSPAVIRNQEFIEGQRVVLAYDLAKQSLRPMTETDRELLVQRRAMEAVHRFTLEHTHGIFRGSCSGVLSISYSDVSYKPSTGSHGFRVPFKLFNIKGSGKSVDLIFSSDNSQFQSFKFPDTQTADKFRQTWNELKALGR